MSQKGILGRKLGMTQVFDDANRVVPVSVIEAGPCRVVQLRTPERDGYSAVQLAFGETKASRINKPELGHLKAAGGPPQRYLAELRVDDLAGFELGQVIAADVFAASAAQGDRTYLPLWSGQGVGLVRDLPGAADVVEAIIREARAVLKDLGEKIE